MPQVPRYHPGATVNVRAAAVALEGKHQSSSQVTRDGGRNIHAAIGIDAACVPVHRNAEANQVEPLST